MARRLSSARSPPRRAGRLPMLRAAILGQRRRLPEERDEALGLDQAAKRGAAGGGEGQEVGLAGGGAGAGAGARLEADHQRRAHGALEVAAGEARVAEVEGPGLALLGDLQVAGERPPGQGAEGPVGGPAAPAHRAPAAVEEAQAHPPGAAGPGGGELGLEDPHPAGGDPRLLRRVGVAEEDLLEIPAPRHVGPVGRIVEDRAEELAGGGQGVARLQERHHVHGVDAVEGGEAVDLEDVGDRLAVADGVGAHRRRTVAGLLVGEAARRGRGAGGPRR